MFFHYQPPAQYTGELFGVAYLYDQSGDQLCPKGDNLESQIDKGISDMEEEVDEPLDSVALGDLEDPRTVAAPSDPESADEEEEVGVHDKVKVRSFNSNMSQNRIFLSSVRKLAGPTTDSVTYSDMYMCCTLQEESVDNSSEALDSQGIPG